MSLWKKIVARYGTATELDDVRLDASTAALITVDYEHHEIHGGDHYFVAGFQDLAINNVLDFTFQMPDTTKWIHWTWRIGTESETLWQVYENVVENNALANAITSYNNNRNSVNTSAAAMRFELHSNLAGANTDTDVSGATLLEEGVSGSGRDAGNEDRASEIIMDQNVLYCLRATATAAGFINFSMQWYEHTAKH